MEDIRKRGLVSDNSDYFSRWGSRNPELTIREELDNQIAAKPTYAGIIIKSIPGGKCTITTFNDGNTPSPERMEKMNCIGKTISDRNGASICGVGQIEGLIAGRKSPQSGSRMTFRSVHSGEVSKFTCNADGKRYVITTENIGPYPIDEPDSVYKTYEGMKDLCNDDILHIKTLCAVKLAPYMKEHPDFIYTVNGERISPIDILYEDVDDDRVKHLFTKDFKVTYHNKEYIVKAGAVDFARYVKPDGNRIDENHANAWDREYKMSPNGGGVFVEIGGVNVITGGRKSWELIGRGYHSTHNGQNVWIGIPDDGELKDAIFSESPNKSDVGICLTEVFDFDGSCIFSSMIEEISEYLIKWEKERSIICDEGKSVKRDNEAKVMKDISENKLFMSKFSDALNCLPKETQQILSSKKLKTLMGIIDSYNSMEEGLF